MAWRLARKEWEAGKGAGNKKALKKIVTSGEVPGILGYVNGEPVAWCAVAPREAQLTAHALPRRRISGYNYLLVQLPLSASRFLS